LSLIGFIRFDDQVKRKEVRPALNQRGIAGFSRDSEEIFYIISDLLIGEANGDKQSGC